MRMLTASITLGALVLLAGCTTLQQYPAFSTGSGRGPGAGTVSPSHFVFFDRRDAHNVLPPSDALRATTPTPIPQSRPAH